MVFFAGAVWSGWRMVDSMISMEAALHRAPLSAVILPAVLLGLATSSRVLGPLAGMLVMGYWLSRRPTWRQARWFLLYAMLAAGVMLATWPYLWEDPLNFVRVFGLMAENPTVLPVLFARQIFPANALPLRYLPFYLGATITEPVWPLAALGLFLRPRQEGDQPPRRAVMALLVGWVLTPLAYVLLLRPPMYDGMRHFLFMLPPAFILAAAGLEMLARWLRPRWVRIVLVGAVLVPGMSGIVLLHPYEYTYYNSLVGGTGGAFRQYETDYWLTCYKEAVERLHDADPGPARLFVHREAAVAEPYADPNITIKEERDHKREIQAGDYILVNSRTNEDLRTDRDASLVLSVATNGRDFLRGKEIFVTTHRERIEACLIWRDRRPAPGCPVASLPGRRPVSRDAGGGSACLPIPLRFRPGKSNSRVIVLCGRLGGDRRMAGEYRGHTRVYPARHSEPARLG